MSFDLHSPNYPLISRFLLAAAEAVLDEHDKAPHHGIGVDTLLYRSTFPIGDQIEVENLLQTLTLLGFLTEPDGAGRRTVVPGKPRERSAALRLVKAAQAQAGHLDQVADPQP